MQSFQGNDRCRFYVMQAGDSIASAANALSMYVPDLQAANPDSAELDLKAGQLLALPPWDPSRCGVLPPNMEVLQQMLQTSMAPPPLPPPTPSPRVGRTPAPAAEGKDPAVACQGYRLEAGDTMEAIALAFSVEIVALMAANPDLAGGAPAMPGVTIVLLPPSDPSCTNPILLPNPALTGGFTSPAAPQGKGVPPEEAPVAEGPSGSASESAAAAAATQPAAAAAAEVAPHPEEEEQKDIYSVLAIADLISGDREEEGGGPVSVNIVSDAHPGYDAPPPPKGSPSAGIYIMAAALCFVLLAIVGFMAMACSNTGLVKTSMRKNAQTDARQFV